jgi:hypothetical protein
MNQKQKSIILNFVTIVTITTVFVLIMANVRGFLNKSEAIRSMELLGQRVKIYRQQRHSTPPKSFVMSGDQSISLVRLGDINYRSHWISYNAEPDTILAYNNCRNFGLLGGKGHIVMFLNGNVTWMGKKQFEQLLAKQQTQTEIELLQKNPKF